jgi:hypothetical protein
MTQQELIKRLETTCFGLDPVDPLRLLVDDVIAALAQTEQNHIPDARKMVTEQEPVVGITAIRTWFKDGRVVTQTLCNSWIDTTPPQQEQKLIGTVGELFDDKVIAHRKLDRDLLVYTKERNT